MAKLSSDDPFVYTQELTELIGSNISPADICLFCDKPEEETTLKTRRFSEIIYYVRCANGKEAKKVQTKMKKLEMCKEIRYTP
jgi:hypothetical protein